MGKIRIVSIVFVVYLLLAFPSFYFVYKFGDPNFGCRDFFDYYKLFKDMDISGVDAPFNMRLLSTFFVHLFYKIGLHYDTETIFDALELDKRVFFCSVLFNYLCVAATSTLIFFTAKKHFNNLYLAFTGGILYLLGFGTLFFVLMPITDALSILLFAWILHGYLSKKYVIILPLLLLIIQREYIFLALGLITLFDYWKYREKYYWHILVVCVFCFVTYMILRKTYFYTPRYDHQASASFFIESIFNLKFPIGPYIKQTFMTMNIFILYCLLLIYKKYNKLSVDVFGFIKLIALFIQINLISYAAVFGNNTGRYFYILIPYVIYQLMKELEKSNMSINGN